MSVLVLDKLSGRGCTAHAATPTAFVRRRDGEGGFCGRRQRSARVRRGRDLPAHDDAAFDAELGANPGWQGGLPIERRHRRPRRLLRRDPPRDPAQVDRASTTTMACRSRASNPTRSTRNSTIRVLCSTCHTPRGSRRAELSWPASTRRPSPAPTTWTSVGVCAVAGEPRADRRARCGRGGATRRPSSKRVPRP